LQIKVKDDKLTDYEKCYKLGYEEGFVTPFESTEAMYWNWMASEFGADYPETLPVDITNFMIE